MGPKFCPFLACYVTTMKSFGSNSVIYRPIDVKFCMRDYYDKSDIQKYFGAHEAKIFPTFGGLIYYNEMFLL